MLCLFHFFFYYPVSSQVSLIRQSELLCWSLSERKGVRKTEFGVMADEEQTSEDTTYKNLLLLGAIAAASAFVVTILIVLVCVGCQR